MAAIHGKIIRHADGSEEEIPVLMLPAKSKTRPIGLEKPAKELERVTLEMPDYESEWESEEERKINTLEATVKRLEHKIEIMDEQLRTLGWMREALKEIDMSKLPKDPNHPNVRAAQHAKEVQARARANAEAKAEANSFDRVWQTFK